MKSFWRALRYVWPHRHRVALAWFCAVVVAGLYFFNVGSALPLFTVMFGGREVTVGTRDTPDPANPDRTIQQPYVIVPAEYAVERVAPGEPLDVDHKALIARVPEGYDVVPGGLERFVVGSEGKFYHGAVAWGVGILPRNRVARLTILLGAIVVLTGLRGALRFFNGWLVGFVACRSVLGIQERAFDKVLRLPLGFFQRGGAAEASSRLINDAFAVREGVQALLGKVILEPLMAVSSLALAVFFALAIDWRILILVFVAGPIIGWVLRTFSRQMRRIVRKALQTAAHILGILEESLAGLRVVKAYSMEGRERMRFFRQARRYMGLAVKAFKTQAATSPSLEFLGTVAIAAAVAVGARIISSDAARDPALVLNFFIALVAAMDPLRKLADVNIRLQSAASGAERIFELIDAEPESRRGRTGIQLPRLGRQLVFEDVRFHYDGQTEDVLKGISLRIEAGETIAVVGRTGCGKTTLVNLVPRFHVPTSGRVLLDGIDIQDGTLRSLRDQIGLVSQETILFSDTIAANIAYGSRPALRLGGRPGKVTREEIVAAAEMAHADEFIETLPEGYGTVLGTLGMTLSGGQRQRLALARAIIRNPAILILDEATSALDEHTQALVQDTLERFVKGRTVIIIAHRLSTIALARRIVVMEAGRIVDIGTHEELLARCGLYRRLRESGFQDT